MTDRTLNRRDIAALALVALAPGMAGRAFASSKPQRLVLNSSTSTSTSTTSTTTTSTSSTSTTLFEPVPLDSYGRTTFADQTWNAQRDTSRSYALQQAVGVLPPRHRFEARSGDSWNGETGRNRTEFSACARQTCGREIWFSYAMCIRPGALVTNWNTLGQFHSTPDDADDPGLSPPFAINLLPGEKLRFLRRYDAAPATSTTPPTYTMYERKIARDHWYRIVGRVIFGWANDGAVDLWLDGSKVISLAGTNIGYNDVRGPYWKFGIYRAAAPETLVVEYANFEIGATSLLTRVTSPLPII